MASSDPKNTRDADPGSNPENFDADEDPLVELARIVSEDAGFASRLPRKPAAASTPPAPRPDAAPPPPEPEDMPSDLEAELMQELETSFARREPGPEPVRPEPQDTPVQARYVEEEQAAPEAVRHELEPQIDEPQLARFADPGPDRSASPEQPEAPYRDELPAEAYAHEEPAEPVEDPIETYAVADQPSEPYGDEPVDELPPVDDPQDLLRSIEQQLSQFERVRSDSYAEEDDRQPVHFPEEAEPQDDWGDAAQPAQPQSDYRFRGPAAAAHQHAEDVPQVAPTEVPTSVAEPAATSEPDAAQAAEAETPRALQEPEAEPDDEETETWAAVSSTDEIGRQRGVADLTSLEEELSRELDPAYAGTPGSAWQAGDRDEDSQPGVAPAAAAAAVIAPEPGMRPPPRPTVPQPQRGRSSRGLATAAAILIVVAIGGAGAMYLRSGDQVPSEPPPVIAAQEGPVKIEPAPSAADDGEEETVGEAVYDRVAGRTPQTEETVVEGAEEPQEIERIVPPLRTGSEAEPAAMASSEAAGGLDAPAADTTTAESAPADDEFGPRRVNTFVVRPDGTIVTTTEASSTDTSSGPSLTDAQSEEIEPRPVETVLIDEPRTPGGPTQPSIGGAAEGSVLADSEEVMSPSVAAGEPMTEPAEEPTELAGLQEEPEPAAVPEEVTETALAEPEPEPVAPPTATSGYLVQISSQTSEEVAEATFADLQSRYASVLSGLEPNIQRADLGERGVYYRVRVGPWEERADAVEVCEALQSAGGDCYVTQ